MPRFIPPNSNKGEVRPWVKKTGRAIKNYGKNVAGGAKMVGGAVKRAAGKLF